MKPNTRLLIRFTLLDGAEKSWGYDAPFYTTLEQLKTSIIDDFVEIPANVEIRLFYYENDIVITATTGTELATVSGDWVMSLGATL